MELGSWKSPKLYKKYGKNTEAEDLYKKAIRIKERTLGPDHPELATCLNNWAISACRKIGGYLEYFALVKKSILSL
jgi:hypothetical protein